MSKASEYNLKFKLAKTSYGKCPFVLTSGDIGVIVNFIEDQGSKGTQVIIDELIPLTLSGVNFENHEIRSATGRTYAELYDSPKRVSFWTGNYNYEIPLQDFIEILQEWKAFLDGLPSDHLFANL